MNDKLIYFILTILLTCITCSYTQDRNSLYGFKNDSSITDQNGFPVNDSIRYFPLELLIDSMKFSDNYVVKPDTFKDDWYSKDLRYMNEPILFNRFLNREIYRFTWLRSFHPQIVIRLEKQGDEIIMIEKKLIEYKSHHAIKDNTYRVVTDSVKVIKSKSILKQDTWDDLNRMLDDNCFSSMSPTVAMNFGLDGAEWILEKHTIYGYFFVDRWSPDKRQYKEFRKICDFIIDNSTFKGEVRY